MIKSTDNLTTNGGKTADTAEAEIKDTAVTVPEKFKDVQTLIKAYSDLEAEFTRRSQRLKELERENKTEVKPDGAEAPSSPDEGEELLRRALGDGRVRDAIIGDYLKNVTMSSGVPLLQGGASVSAPRVAPKSVKEAGRLAKQFLK